MYLAVIHRFVVNRRCRRQPPHTVCRPHQRATNTFENWLNSIKWILNLQCGKWSTCSSHHRNCTEILAIENVSCPWTVGSDQLLIDLHFTETKSQFARDDPAFLVLLILCIFGESPFKHRCPVPSAKFDGHFITFHCFSDVDWIYMDAESDIWPNILLHSVYCGRRFHNGRSNCVNIDVVIHKSIFTRTSHRCRHRMGLLLRCASECIFSTIGATAFRSIAILQQWVSVPVIVIAMHMSRFVVNGNV